MSNNYIFHRIAIEQQENIWLYTYKKWGEAQADKYIGGLHDKLATICDDPTILRSIKGSDVLKNVKFFHYEKHYVFLKIENTNDNKIQVLSILHDRSDIPKRLRVLLKSI